MFGPTNFIGTTIASTARMTVYALDEKGRFLRWPDGATAVWGPAYAFLLLLSSLFIIIIIIFIIIKTRWSILIQMKVKNQVLISYWNSLSPIDIIIIIISLTSIFFQDKSRVWTAASQQH